VITSISNPLQTFLARNTHSVEDTCSQHGCHLMVFDLPKPHLVCPHCIKASHVAQQKLVRSMATDQISHRRLKRFCQIYFKYLDAEQAYRQAYDYYGSAVVQQTKQLLAHHANQSVLNQYARQVLAHNSILTDATLRPASFQTFTVSNAEQSHALHQAQNLAQQYLTSTTPMNTLLTGLAGRGKSHLALSMLKVINAQASPPMTCLFVSTDELFRQIKNSFNDSNVTTTEENMVHLLTSVDLLVLDDLGSESSMQTQTTEATEFVQRVLFGIFNARTRTIITTNLNAKQLSQIYNYKLVSRMMRGVKGHIIKFTAATDDQRMVEF
jgi:DNA replication protein DnaC